MVRCSQHLPTTQERTQRTEGMAILKSQSQREEPFSAKVSSQVVVPEALIEGTGVEAENLSMA